MSHRESGSETGRFFISQKMPDIQVEIAGIKAVSDKMTQIVSDLQGSPFLEGMRDATLLVTRDAKRFAPVDIGRLQANIAPEVRTQGKEVIGVVGSNVKYAPYQELGWTTRGGTKISGKRYLQRALEQNKDKIVKLIGDVVGKIVRK